MSRRPALSAAEESGVEINLAPMIDVVFLLLIFFIVSAGGLEDAGVEVRLPRAATAAELSRTSLLVGLDAQGRLVHGGRNLDETSLRGLVAARQRQEPTPVVLVSDERVPAGRLIQILDLCNAAGAPTVSVATQAP